MTLPTLVVIGGPRDGQELVLEGPGVEKVLGAGPSCHLRLESPAVDLVHAQISWEDKGIVLSDVGSEAGTYVNGERVGADHIVQTGDRISLGPPGSPTTVKLLVVLPESVESALLTALPSLTPALDEGEVFVLAGDEPEVETTTTPPPPVTPPPRAAVTPAHGVPAIIMDDVSAGGPPPATRPVERPQYSNELPSIGGDRVREPVRLPPAHGVPARAKGKARGRMPSIQGVPRVIWVAVGTFVLVGGGFYVYSVLQQPPPAIAGINPLKAEPGQAVTVSGSGFESSAGSNTVRFGDEPGIVTTATPERLTVTVPEGLAPTGVADLNVTVEARGERSNPLFLKVTRVPRVTGLEPDVALPGATVAVNGANLDVKPLIVRVAGQQVDVKAVTPRQLRIVVPDMPMREGQSVTVSVQAGTEKSKPVSLVLGRLPMVIEVVPSSGPAGERVTIKGRGFDANLASNEVTFAGARALILSASPTEIQAAVPPPPQLASQYPMPVVVRAKGAASASAVVYTAQHPSGNIFRPRFVAALAPDNVPSDRHVFVVTQLGPVLILSGRGDAPSLAERAQRVAQRLNSLLDTAAARGVNLELRESPALAVAVAGGDVIAGVTPEDPEGYARSWDGGAKPPRPSTRQVAGHWTALLQDYLSLFAQRARPVRTLESSPRGKVLMEMYAEAERRGYTTGVPTSAVSPLSPMWAKGLHDLALVLPTGAPAAAGAAVVGRWAGTMDEPAGQRPIQVDLRLEGARLTGSVTTQAGGVAMAVPLHDVSYDKGRLRFVLSSGGSSRHFHGTLDGAVLSGTIHGAPNAPPAGRFTLRFIE